MRILKRLLRAQSGGWLRREPVVVTNLKIYYVAVGVVVMRRG
jgi:hypothetical protein